MLEDLKVTCKGQPQLPDPVPSAVSSFEQLEWADKSVWRYLRLESVYNYLRRHKRLTIPVEWRGLMPKRLHEVSEG